MKKIVKVNLNAALSVVQLPTDVTILGVGLLNSNLFVFVMGDPANKERSLFTFQVVATGDIFDIPESAQYLGVVERLAQNYHIFSLGITGNLGPIG